MTRTLSRSVLAALLALTTCIVTHAAPANFIWKATGPNGGTVFLAGSVHLLSPDYYPLNAAFEDAFATTDTLVEELDMGEMLSPDAQMKMLTRGMLPAGRRLDQILTPTTLQALEKALDELGMPLAPLQQFKPWMLAITLQSLAWQKAGFDADLGLDKHFYDKAKVAGKKIVGLETLEFQLSRFDEMPPATQDLMLVETLKELDDTKTNFTEMADAWKTGNVAEVERLVLGDLKSQPEMYKRLLLDRNTTWLPKIEALFKSPQPAFVVVGAAHLVGSDGVIQALKARGYTVTQL